MDLLLKNVQASESLGNKDRLWSNQVYKSIINNKDIISLQQL